MAQELARVSHRKIFNDVELMPDSFIGGERRRPPVREDSLEVAKKLHEVSQLLSRR